MAEIKRYRAQQVFTQPVGVVRSTGAEAASRAWAGVANAGQRIFEMGYQEAKVQQTALGNNFASVATIAKDDEGNYTSVPVPTYFSPVAAKTAEAGLQERYIKQFASDATNAGKLLYAEHKAKGDTQGFIEGWDAITKGQIKAVSQDPKLQKYAGLMQNMMDNVGKAHVASLHGIATDLADRRAYATDYDILKDVIANHQAVASSGAIKYDEESDTYSSVASDSLTEALEAIDRFGYEYRNRVEVGTVPALKAAIYKSHYSGQIDQMLTRLKENIPPSLNLKSENDELGDIMQVALGAFATGRMSDIRDPNVRQKLESAGLTQEFFDQPMMPAIRDELGNIWSKAQGQQKETWNALKDDRRKFLAESKLANGLPVGNKDAELVFRETYGVENATDLANSMGMIIKNESGKNLLMYTTQMPDVVKQFLAPDFAKTWLQQNPQDMPTYMNFYRQATLAQNGKYRAARGLDTKTVQFWEEMDAYSKSGQTMNLPQYLERSAEFEIGGAAIQASVSEKIRQFTNPKEKYSSMDAAVRAFVMEATGNNTDMVTFFSPLAAKLVHAHGAEQAYNIIKNTKDKIFMTSDLLANKERASLYAPEMFYNDKELGVLQTAVATALRTAPDSSGLALGRNVGLVPDRRGTPPIGNLPTSMPTYTLEYTSGPRKGQPVMNANGPIEIGPNAIIAARSSAMRTREQEYAQMWEEHFRMRFGATDKLGRVTRPPVSATFGYQTRFKTIDDAKRAAAEAGN